MRASSLAFKKANRRRKLVITPVNNSQMEPIPFGRKVVPTGGITTMTTNLWLTAAFCLASIPALATPTECALPQPVEAALGEKWHGWRLLQLADLRSDDQTLWREHPLNGKRCPGMNHGKFDAVHTGFVFTLVTESEEQVVMVATSNGGSFIATVLEKPIKVPYFSVVNVLPPGKYKDVYTGRATQIRSDSVAIEAIEASIRLFYFEAGRWKSLQISD
jgi:hypothetical protein